MSNPAGATLTHRYAALQIKIWHILFRMRKIYHEQSEMRSRVFNSKREQIKGLAPSMFSVVDMLVTLEHAEGLMSDLLETKELRQLLSADQVKTIGRAKDTASRWKAVRNVFGGHLDIEVFEAACAKHNFFGSLLSNDLETDMAIYNCLILESAINRSKPKSSLFDRELDFGNDLAGEMKLVIDKLNSDWKRVFDCFPDLLQLMYTLGKAEKQIATNPEEWQGIVFGN